METELFAIAKAMSGAFRQFAVLLEDETFLHKALELDRNPELKEIARKDPHAYFRDRGVHIPSTMNLTIGSLLICYSEGKHGWCLRISSNGIEFYSM
jgi:hypothetical protein